MWLVCGYESKKIIPSLYSSPFFPQPNRREGGPAVHDSCHPTALCLGALSACPAGGVYCPSWFPLEATGSKETDSTVKVVLGVLGCWCILGTIKSYLLHSTRYGLNPLDLFFKWEAFHFAKVLSLLLPEPFGLQQEGGKRASCASQNLLSTETQQWIHPMYPLVFQTC